MKEFRNRWFLFGSRASDLILYDLPLDRIVSVETVDVPFRHNPGFDPEHFFDDLIGVSKNMEDRPQTITFWASAEQSRYIQTKPLHPSQVMKSRNPADGSCIFQIKVVINYEMYSVFMSYGSGVKLLQPQTAADYMRKEMNEAARLYDDSTGDDTPSPMK